jgi:enoyl-CoA hydratase
VILTGRGRMFSSGIDLPRLLEEKISYVEALLPRLSGTLRHLFSFPKPTIAAINGAAVAGGCLLASACDRRLITDDARIGVNEAEIGVAVPSAAIEVLRHACGASFEPLLLNADLLSASDALAAGLVHEVTTREGLMPRVEELATRLVRFDPVTYEMAKDASRQWAVANMESLSSTLTDLNVLEQWSLPATRNNLRRYFPVNRQFTA